MLTPVELPKLGNTVEECLIAKWVRHPGDKVSVGETVLEVETDKAVQEIASPASGVLLATFFEEGAVVPVFTNLFVIGEPGENAEPFRPKSSEASEEAGAPQLVETEPATSAVPVRIAQSEVDDGLQGSFSPRARRFAQEHQFNPRSSHGSGPGGRVLEEDLRELYFSSPRLSGAARKQAEFGSQSGNQGSGIGGMVLSADTAAGVTVAAPAGPAASKLSNIRSRIAQRMRESITSTAQYTLNSWADAGALLTLRARIKASTGLPNANINDMVMYCTVQALLQVPELNVQFLGGKLLKHSEVHLGFACDTPRGLMVPVIRNAHKLSLGALGSKAKELSSKAVQGSISPDDLGGATFSVSNLGSLGIDSFTPILNPPEVAILGVDAIGIKPVRRDGVVQFVDAIGFSLTLDHQIIDGAQGARFLLALKDQIERVESI